MRISRLKIRKLFNKFNYDIEIFGNNKIRILHGLNGTGKTRILKLIDDIFGKKPNFLLMLKTPFNSFKLYFSNNQQIEFAKEDVYSEELILVRSEFGDWELKKEDILEPVNDDRFRDLIRYMRNRYNAKYIGNNSWVMKNEILSSQKLLNVLNLNAGPKSDLRRMIKQSHDILFRQVSLDDYFGSNEDDRDIEKPILTNIIDLLRKINCNFITTKRLHEDHGISTILSYANRISTDIDNRLKKLGQLSQDQDKTFLNRVLDFEDDHNISMEDLIVRLDKVEEIREEYLRIGLIGTGDDSEIVKIDKSKITKSKVDVVSVHIDDAEEKLAIFNDIYNEYTLFRNVINNFLNLKSIKFNQNKGILVSDKYGEVDLEDLSSGEQHIIVLFYDLIFKSKPSTLVLMDEPEISLHISWQEDFIEQLKRVIEQKHFDILIATHSPDIISGNWEIAHALKESE